jgi:hypothetical protein
MKRRVVGWALVIGGLALGFMLVRMIHENNLARFKIALAFADPGPTDAVLPLWGFLFGLSVSVVGAILLRKN